jgi:uncharacterized delta-60 repeat protein
MKKLFIPIMISTLLSVTLLANETPQKAKTPTAPELKFTWKSTFGGSKKEFATSVVGLDGGDVAVLGTCKSDRGFGHGREDLCVIRVNPKGKTLWKKAFGGKKRDLSSTLTQTSDGNLVAVGHGQSFNKSGDFDAYIVKLDTKGNMLWQRAFGGDELEHAYGVAPTKDGGVIVVGTTESYGKGNKDIYLLRLDKDGIKVWQKTLGGQKDDIAYAITPASDGNFILTGSSNSYSKDEDLDFYISKISPKGKQIWAKAYGEEKKDIFRAITPTKDGGCVVAGETESYKSKHSDLDVMKLDVNGEQVWHQLFGFKSIEYATGITQTPEGGYLVVGTTKSMGHGKYDFYVLELDPKGHLHWGNLYGGADKDIAHAVAKTSNNSFVIVGETKSFGNGDKDFFMLDLLKR